MPCLFVYGGTYATFESDYDFCTFMQLNWNQRNRKLIALCKFLLNIFYFSLYSTCFPRRVNKQFLLTKVERTGNYRFHAVFKVRAGRIAQVPGDLRMFSESRWRWPWKSGDNHIAFCPLVRISGQEVHLICIWRECENLNEIAAFSKFMFSLLNRKRTVFHPQTRTSEHV